MRHPATRLLHVLLSVPVLIGMVITVSPTVHAAAPAPVPLVIVIDPGHGGAPDPAHPDMPFDPGAIAASNGVMEKDATLAVSRILQRLLQQDHVNAILTRNGDVGMDVQQREDVANTNHADLFVSVHFNSFTDAGANGSLVLYPDSADIPFAQAMSAAMKRVLGPADVADDGIVLRDNWWIHTTMPTVTVEPAYLSNTHEAALIASPAFQLLLAQSLRTGIEDFDSQVLLRKAQITAWDAAHPAEAVAPPARPAAVTSPRRQEASTGSAWLLRDLLLLLLLAAVVRWPRAAWRTVRAVYRVDVRGAEHVLVHRAANRRRRRAVQRRAHALRAQRFARPHHVYDELF